jgi:2-C-methyl-D-erythritol 4-phosphate cytidylyltransferase
MADDADATDDAAMLARLGHRCRVVEGDRANIKVTYPIDVAIARAIAAWRREAATP